jgi:sensor histidine kinase YesM
MTAQENQRSTAAAPKARRKNTLTGRFTVSFLISTLIPTVVIVGILCLQFRHSYLTTAEEHMKISGSLVADLLNRRFENIDTITMAPYYVDYFSSTETLDPTDPDYQKRYFAVGDELHALFDLTTYSTDDVLDLAVWSDGIVLYHTLYNENAYLDMFHNVDAQPWFTQALQRDGRLVFTAADRAYGSGPDTVLSTLSFNVSRQIRNLRQPDQVNVLILSMSTNSLTEELGTLDLLYDSFIAITGDNGDLIYSSSPLTVQNVRDIRAGEAIRIDSQTFNVRSFPLEHYPLTIHVLNSTDELHHQIRMLVLSAAVVYVIGLAIAYRMSQINSRSVAASVQTINATLSQLENGDLKARCPQLPIVEFNQVSASVNHMAEQLDEKVRNEYLMAAQQKSLQLYALQSQIQPHFLNNLLYNFIALNQMGEREALNTALYSLSHCLRYVLSKERFTTIAEEYSFLEDYLKLQKLRFGDRLAYQLDCPAELKQIRIPRLLLEPLVENAIIHGIEPSETPCTCRLSAVRQDDRLILTVCDDGIGFTPEEMEAKMKEIYRLAEDPASVEFQTVTREKTSVGIYYVRERMKLWSSRAELTVRRENDLTVSRIVVPWEDVTDEPADR